MVLVTGGTNFIGRAVLRKLATVRPSIRALIQPARRSPRLPYGVELDVALAALSDTRGVRAAMVGVDTIIHLAGNWLELDQADPAAYEVPAAENLAAAAADAGVRQVVTLSLLGADRASAYPLLRSKALAEDPFRALGVPTTILRAAIVYGEGDSFTTGIARLAAAAPLLFPIPGDGSTVLQPLWVDDLATCIQWVLGDVERFQGTYEIGGPEYLPFRHIVDLVLKEASMMRIPLPVRQPLLRFFARTLSRLIKPPFISRHWIDYLAVNRTTDLNTLPEIFGLAPRRFEDHIGYLRGKNWGWELLRDQLRYERG
ncbi:MAG: SDR family oxidoreductase [Anaerolineales bacterium]